MIKAKSVTSKISERFNLFEYLESFNDKFIKCKSQNNQTLEEVCGNDEYCKSQNNQTLEKVCGSDEYFGTNKNDAISCKRKHSIVDKRLTKGDICRDLQFLKAMNYPKDSISYVESKVYDGKKKIIE